MFISEVAKTIEAHRNARNYFFPGLSFLKHDPGQKQVHDCIVWNDLLSTISVLKETSWFFFTVL